MLIEALAIVGILALLLYGLHWYSNAKNDYWPKMGVTWVDANKISSIYSRMTLKVDFMEFSDKLYNSVPDSVKFFGFNEMRSTILCVRDLDLIKKILVKDFDHFMDRRSLIKSDTKVDPYMGRMLVNLAGQEWKDLRSIMSPTFTTGKIRRMFEFFNSCGHHLADYLRNKKNADGGNDDTVDFQDCFGRYTMDVIASAAFGVPTDVFKEEDSTFIKMARRFQLFSYKRLLGMVIHMLAPFLANLLRIKVADEPAMDFFSKIVKKNIQLRREHQGDKRQDFLQLLLETQTGQLRADEAHDLNDFEKDALLVAPAAAAKKESTAILDDTTIISQCVLFFVAGADTILSALNFAVYDLALHPEYQEKLATEVTTAMDEHDGNLTYDDTNHLEYLDMFLSESMRIHPIGFITERVVTQDYKIPDTDIVIPKGVRVQIPIGSIQKSEKYYPDPLKFNPENFTAENKAKRHPYAYMPFGAGPRNCIAMRFAMTEAKAALSHLVYNFRVEPCEKTQIPLKLSKKNFKPEKGMWLRFTPRR